MVDSSTYPYSIRSTKPKHSWLTVPADMGICGTPQITILAPRQDATVRSWSLPAYLASISSFSIGRVIGNDNVIVTTRIAEALKIYDGDYVDFFINSIGETWRLKVAVRDNIKSDVIIHDIITLGLAEQISMSASGEEITLKTGTVMHNLPQEMFAGMRIIEIKGSAKLYFDGASQNNPYGPCGYGFHIERTDEADVKDTRLVYGYGFSGMEKSSNQMEYEGLIEGLVWALRLDLKTLTIVGDSELIIKQLTGEYSIKNHRLKALHMKVQEMLRQSQELEVTYLHIPREENQIADGLANCAISTRVNVTTCNWSNINRLMKRAGRHY